MSSTSAAGAVSGAGSGAPAVGAAGAAELAATPAGSGGNGQIAGTAAGGFGIAAAAESSVPPAEPHGGELADEVLVARLRGGETAAGEVLVRRYFQPLIRYLQRLAGNDQVAEELHQQTWLSVLEHIEKFDAAASGAGGFKAWLFRIATNKANDLWRARGRERAAKEGLRLVTESEAPPSGTRLDATEQEARLRLAIERLPEPQRQVLLLRYYGNLKFVEIAELLGCPLNTALGRMHKAMLKLKQMMDA